MSSGNTPGLAEFLQERHSNPKYRELLLAFDRKNNMTTQFTRLGHVLDEAMATAGSIIKEYQRKEANNVKANI